MEGIVLSYDFPDFILSLRKLGILMSDCYSLWLTVHQTVFAVFLFCFAAFLLYSIVQQVSSPWELVCQFCWESYSIAIMKWWNFIVLLLYPVSHGHSICKGCIEFMFLAPSFASYKCATFHTFDFSSAALSCLLHGGCWLMDGYSCRFFFQSSPVVSNHYSNLFQSYNFMAKFIFYFG